MAYKQKSPIPVEEGGTNATTMTDLDGVVIYNGVRMATIPPLLAGRVLTSNGPILPPSFQDLPSSSGINSINGNTGSVTPTAGVVTISGDGTVLSTSGSGSTLSITSTAATTITATTGSATASSNTFTFVGATGISTSATGSTVTITGTATSITLAGNTGSISGSSFTLDGSGVISSAASGSSVTFSSTAANVINGGTGSATASGNAFTVTGTGPISTSATGSTVTVATTAANTINATSGTATASSNAFTIVGAGTVSTSATGSTVTITGTGGGLTWNNVTGTTQAMSVNSGYIANNAGLVTLTLPATAAVGDVIGVQGSAAGLWTIAQNSGQTIHFNAVNSTTGVGGSVSATSRYDSVYLICIVANTDFVINGSTGNLSVV